jgi:anti-sigma factor RsiW
MEQRPDRTNADCDAMGELISAYIDDELEPRELPAFGKHLRACPACAAALEQMAAQKTLLRRSEPYWPVAVPSAEFGAKLAASLAGAAVPGAPFRARARARLHSLAQGWPMAAAVTMTLILATSAALLVSRTPDGNVADMAEAPRARDEQPYTAGGEDLNRYLRDHAMEAAEGSLLSDAAETLELAAYVP